MTSKITFPKRPTTPLEWEYSGDDRLHICSADVSEGRYMMTQDLVIVIFPRWSVCFKPKAAPKYGGWIEIGNADTLDEAKGVAAMHAQAAQMTPQ